MGGGFWLQFVCFLFFFQPLLDGDHYQGGMLVWSVGPSGRWSEVSGARV